MRYHLLRNGLILEDIRITRGRNQLHIPHLLIRANPQVLIGENPKVVRVEASGFNASLWQADLDQLIQGDDVLQRIWFAIQSMKVDDGNVTLFLQDSIAAPLKLQQVSLLQYPHHSLQRISASARVGAAVIDAQWKNSRVDSSLLKAEINWYQLQSATFFNSIGLAPLEGSLAGFSQWQRQQGEEGFNIEGSTTLTPSGSHSPHQLSWSGSSDAKGQQLSLQAREWPLHLWREQLPQIEGRRLDRALFNGAFDWHYKQGRSTFTSQSGLLNDVSLTGQSDGTKKWQVETLEFQNASLNPARYKLNIDQLSLQAADITLTSEQQSESSQHQAAALWQTRINKVKVKELDLQFIASSGRLNMNGLHGSVTHKSDNSMLISLKSDAPDDKLKQQTVTHWKIKGRTHWKNSMMRDASLKIYGKRIPLAQLRPFLPVKGASDRPISLSGEINLKLKADLQDLQWQLTGQAKASNIGLAYAGETWRAESLTTSFGPLGTAVETPRIDALKAENWHYITALDPLDQSSQKTITQRETVVAPSWWKAQLIEGRWDINHIELRNGRISVGHSEAYWAEQLNVTMDHLAPGVWSDFSLQGHLGTGDLVISGKLDLLHESQRFIGSVNLDNASPFFLHEWFAASGIPKLTRGRLSAKMLVEQGSSLDQYKAKVSLQLQRGQIENRSMAEDPMIGRTGFNSAALLMRMNHQQRAKVDFELDGNWKERPLSWHTLGLSLQTALHHEAVRERGLTTVIEKPLKVVTRIRLHGIGNLGLNERNRLRRILRKIKNRPDWIIELSPKWTGKSLNEESLRRIAYTQYLIERFFTHREISQSRIFPSWPGAEDRANEIASIWVKVGPPD